MRTKSITLIPQFVTLVATALITIVLSRSHPSLPVGITQHNIEQIEEVERLGEGRSFRANWSPDGQLIALVGSIGIRIYDVADLDAPARWLDEQEGFVYDAAFSPQGDLLASGAQDGLIRLWDTRTWELVTTLAGHEAAIQNILFSPDGRTLVSFDFDYNSRNANIRLWNIDQQRQIAVMSHPTYAIDSLSISPDSRLLATKNNIDIRIWSLIDGHDLATLPVQRLHSRDKIAFSQDGKWLVGGDKRLRDNKSSTLWLIDSQSPDNVVVRTQDEWPPFVLDDGLAAYLDSGTTEVVSIAPFFTETIMHWGQIGQRSRSGAITGQDNFEADPTGQSLLVRLNDQTELWSATDPDSKTILQTHIDDFRQMNASPNGDSIAATTSYMVHMWNMTSEGQEYSWLDLRRSGGYLPALYWYQDSFRGLFRNDVGSGRLLDLTAGSVLYNFETVRDNFVYSPDQRYVATPGLDHAMTIFNLETGELVSSFVPSPDDPEVSYWPLAFSPDASLLASVVQGRACGCSLISLWNTATGAWVSDLGKFHLMAQSGIFTADGSKLIVGGGGHGPDRKVGSIQVWDLKSGRMLGQYEGTQLSIEALDISPDGHLIAGTGYGDVWLWDITAPSGQTDRLSLLREEGEEKYVSALLNPQGDLLLVGTAEGDILVFDPSTGQQIRTLKGHKGRVTDLLFVDNGRMLLSASSDGTVRVWGTEGTVPVTSLSERSSVVPTVAVTPTAGM